MVRFNCLKWGDKYGPEYVNRLYNSILRNYDGDFEFVCYTDNTSGVETDTDDINLLRPYDTDRVFTYEKLFLIRESMADKNYWVDLDILIHGDLTGTLNRPMPNFTMLWNYWNDYESKSLQWYGTGSSCHINSSFVGWTDADWLLEYTEYNWEKIQFTYKSLDKYLFYQHARKNRLSYWPFNFAGNYNKQNFEVDLSRKITLFNTSHIKANNLKETGYEIHQVPEIRDLWY